jgi:phosphatidylglycerophosphate synthase
MLDAALRPRVAPLTDAVAFRLARRGVPAGALTGAAFTAGAAACVAIGLRHYDAALLLFLVNRVLDGLDGPVARLGGGATDRGGYLDLVSDFAIYGGFVAGLAVAQPDARLACVALLGAYYVSGTAFLAFSSLAERRSLPVGDERSLRFVGGLAEGAETIIVYVLFCLAPDSAAPIAWAFAVVVAVTAIQRVVLAVRVLR